MTAAEVIEYLDTMIAREAELHDIQVWRVESLVTELGERVVRALLRETAAGPRL